MRQGKVRVKKFLVASFELGSWGVAMKPTAAENYKDQMDKSQKYRIPACEDNQLGS